MKVMLIDDEPLSLSSMERLLRRYGVAVCGAFTDPTEAVRQAPALSVDVAFIDIEMPEMNGLEAAERLQTALPELRIVFVTAYDQYAVNAFELNATDYLLKPVQPKRLEATLERLASRSQPKQDGAAERPGLLLRCFLRLSVTTEDGRDHDIPWRTTKAKEIFAFLLHMRNKLVSKDVLIDLIWPELDLSKSQTHLHTTVYQIRQTLKSASLPIKLNYADGGYRLDLSGCAVDTDVWERQLAPNQGGAASSAEELRRLTGMYRGDYLELEGYLWAEQERERLRVKWLEHALRFAARLVGGQSWSSEAHSLLMAMIERFPAVQESYFLLMRMYHAQGRAQEVRKTYAQLCEALQDETGEDPSEEIETWIRTFG